MLSVHKECIIIINMREEDPERLAALFEDYRKEYIESRGEEDVVKKRRTLENIEDECMRTEDLKRINELFEQYATEYKKQRGATPQCRRSHRAQRGRRTTRG